MNQELRIKNKIVVLSGGVGGARFLEGLLQIRPQEKIFVIGNTGDDEDFYGLHVSPDLDIVLYTLSDVINREQGWGFKNETYTVMDQLTKLGNTEWFRLGDHDLAVHIHRTNLLKNGSTLSDVTDELVKSFGLKIKLVPMTNDSVKTFIKTTHGIIPFQEYFVKNRWQNKVLDIVYFDAQKAKPAHGIIDTILSAEGIILAPSNPFVSIDTILSIPGIKEALIKTKAKITAISPVIAGETIKGPAVKMMKELGHEASAVGVARHYKDFLDVMIIDKKDEKLAEEIEKIGVKTVVTNTVMTTIKIKTELAKTVIDTL
jgi:LPPG:FO 2-phospho-L-lactate transferase